MRVALPIRAEPLSRAVSCDSAQCLSCPIYQKYCAGIEACCFGGYADEQNTCQGECESCLAMRDEATGRQHDGAPDVCGKPESLLRTSVRPVLPLPVYTRKLRRNFPAYIPTLNRLPRGAMRKLKLPGVVAIQTRDIAERRHSPELWLDHVEKPLLICTEQDHLQEEHEAWYGSWVRRALRDKWLWAATGIEFSAYVGHGNLSHFRSIQRALSVANAGRVHFWTFYPHARLLIDDVLIAWMKAVPNVFVPYGFEDARSLFRLRRLADQAVGGVQNLRILLVHVAIDDLEKLPKDVRASSSWVDTAVMLSAMHGGDRRAPLSRKLKAFYAAVESRRERVTKILRG